MVKRCVALVVRAALLLCVCREAAAQSTHAASGWAAIERDLRSSDSENRESATYRLEGEANRNEAILSVPAVRAGIVDNLIDANHELRHRVSTDEDWFGDYYDTVLSLSLRLLSSEGDAGRRERLIGGLVYSAFNPDSILEQRLAQWATNCSRG
jgi:hypothetical protein